MGISESIKNEQTTTAETDGSGKESEEIQNSKLPKEECLREDTEKMGKTCHKTAHPGRNTSG
jgi:hypothetical protein